MNERTNERMNERVDECTVPKGSRTLDSICRASASAELNLCRDVRVEQPCVRGLYHLTLAADLANDKMHGGTVTANETCPRRVKFHAQQEKLLQSIVTEFS
eukprot:INCI10885.1.p1 GENE.INCI10885.1~~INCI10885.1.p1  ORF type:complete len:101 (+),score=15.40 INCI10885.1:213-515(+)